MDMAKVERGELEGDSILRIVDDNFEYRIVQMHDDDGDVENDAHMLLSDEEGSSPQYFVISDGNLSNIYASSSNPNNSINTSNNNDTHRAPVAQPKPHQKRHASSAQQMKAIAPKAAGQQAATAPSTTKDGAPVGKSSSKGQKRDERRRVTHNEIERRRRDKINHWIEKLGSIIPVDGQPSGSLLLDRQTMSNSGMTDGQSKGGILSKACEYVTALHHKVNTLNDCLKESEKINIESQRLRESNARLAIENEQLRERLSKLGIRPPCIVLSPSASTNMANGRSDAT